MRTSASFCSTGVFQSGSLTQEYLASLGSFCTASALMPLLGSGCVVPLLILYVTDVPVTLLYFSACVLTTNSTATFVVLPEGSTAVIVRLYLPGSVLSGVVPSSIKVLGFLSVPVPVRAFSVSPGVLGVKVRVVTSPLLSVAVILISFLSPRYVLIVNTGGCFLPFGYPASMVLYVSPSPFCQIVTLGLLVSLTVTLTSTVSTCG